MLCQNQFACLFLCTCSSICSWPCWFVPTIRWINLIFPLRRNDETLTNLKYATNINADVRSFGVHSFKPYCNDWATGPTQKQNVKSRWGYICDEKWQINSSLRLCHAFFLHAICNLLCPVCMCVFVCVNVCVPNFRIGISRETETLSVHRHGEHDRMANRKY